MGYIYNINETNDLPKHYRFKLGGQTSLRGWAKPDDYNVEGDLVKDMVNFEYRFPIKNKFGGELFLDAGRLYSNIDQFISAYLSWNIGIGIIYYTTLGPIRVDIGFPFGDFSKPQPHASLLYMF